MACEILYNENAGYAKLRKAFSGYMRGGTFDRFIIELFGRTLPEDVSFQVKVSDDATDAQKSMCVLYEHITDLAHQYMSINPQKIAKVEDFLQEVNTKLFIDADRTQSASTESNPEHKTIEEVFDEHRSNFEEHKKDIYGYASINLISALEQEFQDLISNAAFINSRTGEVVVHTNEVLNNNISELRRNLSNRIKLYLDAQGIKYENTSWGALRTFYTHLKSIENFNEILVQQQSEKTAGTSDAIDRKKDIFKDLMASLKLNPEFGKFLDRKFKRLINRPIECLYLRESFSPYYAIIKEYVQAHGSKQEQNYINQIETDSINLLEATNAYSMLTQFDNMLTNAVGKQIKIQNGTHGLDVPNKYSFSHDTSHEHKGWQTSEDVGSDRHTSKMTKTVLSQIRIYNHKTDESKHRRLDSTSYIVAARHLLDDILYGNIKFTGSSEYIKACEKLIKNAVMTFHTNPQEKLRQILEILFSTPVKNQIEPFYKKLTNKKLLTDYDLDILYSVYLKAFDTSNPNSIISQEINKQTNHLLTANLLQEISAYADSNITMDYLETSTDWETGLTTLIIKKKYFNNQYLYKLRQNINRELNAKSISDREKLSKLYGFTYGLEACSINLGDFDLVLEIPKSSKNHDTAILDPAGTKLIFSKESRDLFKNLEGVNLVEFRKYWINGTKPSEQNELAKFNQLNDILQFIDSYLGLNILSDNGLQTLHIYKSTYKPIDEFSSYLMPLVQLAMRAAYVNEQYIKAGEKPLVEYLKESDDRAYKHYIKYPKSKLFSPSYGDAKYVVASYKDPVLEQWADAVSMFTGEASKATTKDGEGNSIPNNSVGKLGGNLHHYLFKQRNHPNTSVRSLMFVDDPSLVKSTFHDLEARNIHKDSKNIKNFTSSELFFHAIFNKFWAQYANHGTVVIQPTVYSDKTTFLNWEIGDIKELLEDDYVTKVENKYIETIGNMYSNVSKRTKEKFNKLVTFYNKKHGENLNVAELLKKHSESQLIALLNAYNESIENQASNAATSDLKNSILSQKISGLEMHKDYRVIKKDGVEFCVLNELLEYNARVFKDKELLRKYLTREKYNFLQNLIDANASFQVLNFDDKLEYYTGEKINEKATSHNAVITTILNNLNKKERADFFKKWVDAKTGKLVLAKQGGRNILGIAGDFDKSVPGLILNPFLNKFFYVEGLLSNNLRMSLTGSEINHPPKLENTLFDIAKKAPDYEKFKDETQLDLTFKEYSDVAAILNKCDSVGDLAKHLNNPTINHIYKESIIRLTNAAQGAQFKRNVIIPATLQYCQQGTKDGITSKIKCAVIYDKEASVFNYRGQSKGIDSADGSAQINPFQSILENKSLGSQAVGFIKKPIWHSYDEEGCTAFLAKFATDTITNESMRASMHSKTSLFKLFKRMTNLQWKEPIDLTKPIQSDDIDYSTSAGHATWVSNILFGGQKLLYKNQFGDTVQIINFKKSNLTLVDPTTGESKIMMVYNTVEKMPDGTQKTVYHTFDGDSNHYTTTSIDEAKKRMLNGHHTINSLFELHSSLGGIHCVDSKGNGSEFSNEVVVNFMNNIGYKKPGVTTAEARYINQDTYYQPLKQYHIGYTLNNTAVKNGAKNINSSEAWDGDMELSYFEVDSDGLGMQMNADHDIVNSELTEFSQVIAATSAYGYTYDQCHQIFKGLAKTALQASKHAIEAVDTFIQNSNNPQAKSDLYDAIGRLILVEGSIKDKESLKNMILTAVSDIFTNNRDHADDSVKIPYSDPNIHSEFANILASVITKASIKRKHPGSGCVMVPGYDIITYFEVGDKKYSHTDMLKTAKAELLKELREVIKTSPKYDSTTKLIDNKIASQLTLSDLFTYPEVINYLDSQKKEGEFSLSKVSDATLFNKMVVDKYLDKLQAEAPIYTSKDYFQPEDVVRILTPKLDPSTNTPLLDESGNPQMHESVMVLDSMKKYYDFKNHQYPAGTVFQVDVKTPRNLKPSLIRWRYNPTSSLEELRVTRSKVYDKTWKDDKTQSNKAFTLSLDEDPTRQFEIVKDHEEGYWSVHFKTIPDGDTFESFTPLTEEQKTRLFKAAADAIPIGDKLSTWGSLTPGGVSGINRFKSLGFKQVGTREVTDREGNPIQIPVLEKTGVYMNIFDHPVIKDAFDKKGKLDQNHRKSVQKVLDDLHAGFFVMNGVKYNIIPNSLENTEAELVMSNIYKDTFGIENESLQEILDQGEQFFLDQIQSHIKAPYTPVYDVSLLKDNGKHALIKFGKVVPNENCIEHAFETTAVIEKVHTKTNTKKYGIYYMKGNRPLFKIGEYVNLSEEERGDLYIENGEIKSKSNKEVDRKMYRIYEGQIQKRIDFIKRYNYAHKTTNNKTGQIQYTTYPLYKIIDRSELVALFGNEADAHKQIGDLIAGIYTQDSYKFIELNPMKQTEFRAKKNHIKGYVNRLIGNYDIPESNKDYLSKQLELLGNVDVNAFKELNDLKRKFYEEEAHKKWVSFQDSLKFISSRIPAQTLQSFMAMRCVGWTENTNNMAYVSHFQTYLQGSDYDIDKAYVMGQSYDSNGKYTQWSPLFDYTSAETLAISKQLPVPDDITLTKDINGVDVSQELQVILDSSDESLEPISYNDRVRRLKALVSVLNKIDKANGSITYTQKDSPKMQLVMKMLDKHFKYVIPDAVAEAAYKNVASANIYAVSHDIRNRDQSYTEISMNILKRAAANSPKGEQAATLNMLNPLTKYVMQYQNIVGKNVIGVAANGEKIWFNTYYYWTKLLKEGKHEKLKFQTTLTRVAGRSGLETKELSSLPEGGRTVTTIPDLNPKDTAIKNALLNEFGVDLDKEPYAYVDQLISQLLSAATDNAKELILAKINSGSNFARMYVYLIMTGYNFDDIVSFMISPVSEFIDSMSNPNMFQDNEMGNNASKAINLAKGIVKSSDFLHGYIYESYIDEDTGEIEKKNINKTSYVLAKLKRTKYFKDADALARAENNMFDDEDMNLDTLMQGYIMLSLQNPEIDLSEIIKTSDMEINSYLQYCQNIAHKLREVSYKYENISEMFADASEFKKIYSLATEISGIASAWLGLNQGLPSDDLGLLKRFSSMQKVITGRERSLGIFESKIFTDSADEEDIEIAARNFDRVVNNILENNAGLSEAEVRNVLNKAHEKGLIGTFDVYKYLTDMQYRQDMIEYNHIIKGTLNVLDMMEEIPHYKQIIKCLTTLAVSRTALSSKNRLLTKLMQETNMEYLSDQELKGIIRYADKLNGVNFFRSFESKLGLKQEIEGFDTYFNKVKASEIDLSTFNGMATFKHWIEHEFLEDLRNNYRSNPLVSHLKLVGENQRSILATDIDLLQPNTTTGTIVAYDEIIRGMAEFELEKNYKNTGYSIADLFQMYNILVNSNQYGSERLTTAFKKCSDPNNILHKYWQFVADQDYEHEIIQDYELWDYYINAAPLVSTGAERFRKEKFIKVNDPVEGYILKQYDEKSNSYTVYPLIPVKEGIESPEHRLKRLQNFVEYCPYEMPVMAKVVEMFAALNFEGDVNDDILLKIKNIILDFSSSGKLIIFKDC